MKTSMTIAAVAAASTVSASSPGSIAVVNNCQNDIYLWSVGGTSTSQMFTLKTGTGYKETFRYISEWSGVSLKVAPYYMNDGDVPDSHLNVTQFEYTVAPPQNNDPNIYYDLSFVNGDALGGIPFTYSPSNPGQTPQCIANNCGGDYEVCKFGYLYPTDDGNTHACSINQDILFTLCNGASGQGVRGPTGQVTLADFDGMNCWGGACNPYAKRDAIPEPEPEAEPQWAACVGQNGKIGLCLEPTSTTSTAAAPTTTSSSSSSSSSSTTTPTTTPVKVPTAAAIVALQQPAKQSPTTSSTVVVPTTSSTTAAAVATVPVPVPVTIPSTSTGGIVGNGLFAASRLQNIAEAGANCWYSIEYDGCGGSAKRDVIPTHRHNHQSFHRRNRHVKSA